MSVRNTGSGGASILLTVLGGLGLLVWSPFLLMLLASALGFGFKGHPLVEASDFQDPVWAAYGLGLPLASIGAFWGAWRLKDARAKSLPRP